MLQQALLLSSQYVFAAAPHWCPLLPKTSLAFVVVSQGVRRRPRGSRAASAEEGDGSFDGVVRATCVLGMAIHV